MPVIPLISIVALHVAMVFIWIKFLRAPSAKKGPCEKCKSTHYNDNFTIAAFSFACIFVVSLYFFFAHLLPGSDVNLGEAGDFIGGLTNPLLSFAALIVLIRTTTMQNSVIDKQLEAQQEQMDSQRKQMESQQQQLDSQKLLTFRDHFYSLRSNMWSISERMDKEDSAHVIEIYDRIRSERKSLAEKFPDAGEHKLEAKKFLEKLIRHKDFDRFSLSVRRAMKQVDRNNLGEKFDYAIIIRDSMTARERVIFLNWTFYYWRDAKTWFVGTWSQDNKEWLPYEFTGGMDSDDFLSDEVRDYFDQKLPK